MANACLYINHTHFAISLFPFSMANASFYMIHSHLALLLFPFSLDGKCLLQPGFRRLYTLRVQTIKGRRLETQLCRCLRTSAYESAEMLI